MVCGGGGCAIAIGWCIGMLCGGGGRCAAPIGIIPGCGTGVRTGVTIGGGGGTLTTGGGGGGGLGAAVAWCCCAKNTCRGGKGVNLLAFPPIDSGFSLTPAKHLWHCTFTASRGLDDVPFVCGPGEGEGEADADADPDADSVGATPFVAAPFVIGPFAAGPFVAGGDTLCQIGLDLTSQEKHCFVPSPPTSSDISPSTPITSSAPSALIETIGGKSEFSLLTTPLTLF
jgi:hypothetical protein